MVADARSTPARERPGPHRRGGSSSFPLLARTQTFRRPVGKAAYDCATVIVIRDGSALLLSDFGQEPVTIGDVVLVKENVPCGSEPEGE
ncbi:hypothetical protein [Brevibacterium sp. FME37]|uniref:hypothetical protein n=1 Tax=Brevibacterium sp. FME37 TaxID=2742607 RepID=UPI001D01E5A7|nr:hypothetical protein [Brevibacterium sp. FME37]